MNAVQPEAVQRVPRVRALCAVVHTVVCLGQRAGCRYALSASGLEPSLLTGNYRAVRPAVHDRPTR